MKLYIPICNNDTSVVTSAIRHQMLVRVIKSFEVIPIYIDYNGSTLKRFQKIFELIIWAVRIKEPCCMYISGSPFWLFLLACVTLIRPNIKIFLEYRDPWSGDIMRQDNVLRRFCVRKIEQMTHLSAAGIFVISDEIKRAIPVTRFTKSKIILTSTELNCNKIKILKAGSQTAGSIIHLGNIDRLMSINEVASYINTNHCSRFEFYGNWDTDALQIFKRTCVNTNVEMYDRMAHDDALVKMASAHALLLMGSSTQQRLHRKTFEYIYMEKPIIYFGSKTSPTYRLLERFCEHSEILNGGFLFNPIQKEKLIEFEKEFDEKFVVKAIEDEISKLSRM